MKAASESRTRITDLRHLFQLPAQRILGEAMASRGTVPDSSTRSLPRHSAFVSTPLSLLLLIATIAVYAPVHHHPFSNIDDPTYILFNKHIADGLNPSMVLWACTHGYASNWHPVTWMSHALDIQVFGLKPAGHHDESVLLHAINAIVLFWVLRLATARIWRSAMLAAVFALHPINVESVAWVAERKTLLSALFCLLALGAYRWYAKNPGRFRYTLVAGLFVLGLMCKPQVIMLPLVLLVWDYWPLGRMRIRPTLSPNHGDHGGAPMGDHTLGEVYAGEFPRKSFWWLVKEKVPLFVISVVDAGVTLLAQHLVLGESLPLWERAENAVVSYCRYIRKAFWPSDLALYYVHPEGTLHWWQWAGACVVLLLITVFVLRVRQPYLAAGWLWFLIMLLPTIGLVPLPDVLGMADRYAYLSFLGLFLMVCWGVGDWAERVSLPKAILPAIGTLILAALALVAHHQVAYWADDVTLWTHSTQVTGSWKAEMLLGQALHACGRHDAANQHYLRAAAKEKHDSGMLLAIASYEHTQGNLPMALEYYQRAEKDSWTYDQRASALMGMWGVYELMGDKQKANDCVLRVRALPKNKPMDWQGAWWKQIVPLMKQRLHLSTDADAQN